MESEGSDICTAGRDQYHSIYGPQLVESFGDIIVSYKAACKPRKRKSGSKPKKTRKVKANRSCSRKSKKARAKAKTKSACSKRTKPKSNRKQCKLGLIMKNGYLSFLRVYRGKHSSLKPSDLIMKAARAWYHLSEKKKEKFRRIVSVYETYNKIIQLNFIRPRSPSRLTFS